MIALPNEHRHARTIAILAGTVIALLISLLAVGMHISLSLQKEKLAQENNFLKKEEAVIVRSETEDKTIIVPIQEVLFEYVEVTGGCGAYFEDPCLNARSGPGTEYPVISKLRNGIVLKVGGKIERDGQTWYKIVFDEWIRYPERIKTDWYVAADYVRILLNEGNRESITKPGDTTTKRIIVDRSDQTLSAYDGDELFMQESISTGVELTPTPRGTFTIFKKTPSRYMQGPIPQITEKEYDLPGVPWNLYFTIDGAVIHGTYWHENFGKPSSNGCVNLPPAKAQKLYLWAEIGTKVIVQE